MKMSEIHQGRQNNEETYSKNILITLGHWLGRKTEFKKTEGRRRSCHHETISPFKDYPNLPKTIIQQVFIKILISQFVRQLFSPEKFLFKQKLINKVAQFQIIMNKIQTQVL